MKLEIYVFCNYQYYISCLLLNGIYIICINYYVFGDDIFSDKFLKIKWCLWCCFIVNEELVFILLIIIFIKNFINKYYLVLVLFYFYYY